MENIFIIRRVGPHPHSGENETKSSGGCPDVFELSNGDFAIIGRLHTTDLRNKLPPDASCGPDEAIVVVDRAIMLRAKPYISE